MAFLKAFQGRFKAPERFQTEYGAKQGTESDNAFSAFFDRRHERSFNGNTTEGVFDRRKGRMGCRYHQGLGRQPGQTVYD